MQKKYKNLFSNTAIFAISNIISKLILSLLLPLYTRTMTTAQYGTVELITTIANLLYPTLSLSIQDAAFRFAMDKNNDKNDVLKNSLVVMLFGAIAFVPVSFLMQYYNGINGLYVYFYLFSVLSMIRSMLSLYIKGRNKTLVFSIDTVFFNLCLALGNIICLAFLHLEIDGYFYAAFTAQVLSIIYLALNSSILKAVKTRINMQLMKTMLKYSAPLILNSISWGLTHVVDRMMLTSMIGADANGIYSAASKIPALLSLVTSVFTQAWIISLIQDYETERDQVFYNNIFKITHVGCVFVTLGILLFNNNVFVWILGKSFAESVKYVPILLIGTLFLTYSNFFGAFFSASKQSALNMYTSVTGAIINVTFNYLLIPFIGIMGACIATASSYVCISVLRIVLGLKIQPVNMDTPKYYSSMVLIFVSAICVSMNKFDVPVVIFSLLFCCLMYREYLNQLRQIVKKRLQNKHKATT